MPAAMARRGPRVRRRRSEDARDRWGVAGGLDRAAHLLASAESVPPSRLRGTPMRHLSPRLAAGEVLLLSALVIDPPRRAPLVLRPRPLQPLAPGHRRARRTVEVASITAAADADRPPASRAREDSRIGRRHRSGVPRALQVPRRTRSWSRLSGPSRHRSRLTRRPGMRPRASTLRTPAWLATLSGADAIGPASPPVGHF